MLIFPGDGFSLNCTLVQSGLFLIYFREIIHVIIELLWKIQSMKTTKKSNLKHFKSENQSEYFYMAAKIAFLLLARLDIEGHENPEIR